MIGVMEVPDRISEISFTDRKTTLGLSIALLLIIGVSTFIVLNDSEADNPEDRVSEEQFNRNDVMFMNMMIVHHDQAIKMSELAENRTDNENILELSRNISQAQKAENQQMTEWMRSLGFEPGNHHPMAGMASREEMQQLRDSNGSEFNQLFAELMIEHHEGGIAMARNFRETGRHSELKQMQGQMIEAQQKEIAIMRKWQEEDQL